VPSDSLVACAQVLLCSSVEKDHKMLRRVWRSVTKFRDFWEVRSLWLTGFCVSDSSGTSRTSRTGGGGGNNQ
jgi:hypothetical protein